MANLKFSQFETKTVITDVNFLVGYTDLENVQISTSNLFAGFGTGTANTITMWNATGTGIVDSIITQQPNNTEIRITGALDVTTGITTAGDIEMSLGSISISAGDVTANSGIASFNSFVKTGGTALEYLMADGSVTTAPPTGVTEFIELTDTPNNYICQPDNTFGRGKNVKVNSAGSALEFTPDYFDFACSDEETNLTAGNKKFTIVFTRAFNCVSEIRFSVTQAPIGADIILEVSKNGTSIFAGTNYPTIDAGTNTTNVSASSQFISGGYVDFAVGDEMKVGITQVGAATSAGTGLKASMVYNNCPCF
jgi:hypothetical protein